tara:strand:+ start:646 stop:1158 length:513 start_codon:yes stop_codon:yes gene_type:complete
MKIYLLIYLKLFFSFCLAKENKLFWDGHDWNRVSILTNNDQKNTFRIKSAYLDGILDGRLNYYLKVWVKDQYLADDVFGETVDYLSKSELIKNIDYFYKDRLNIYIPIPSAIVISNMYAERVPVNVIEEYIGQTRRWINDLTLDMDTLNYSKLIEDKILKHQNKSFNQFE